MRLLTLLLILAALAAAQHPAPLTTAERLAVMELLAAKYAADAEESDLRIKLEAYVQEAIGKARQKRAEQNRALEDKVTSLAAERKIEPSDWKLDIKTGAWKKREPSEAKQPQQPHQFEVPPSQRP